MWWAKIMQMISRIQMMFQPKINLINAQTQWPSENLVMKPRIQEVIGMIQRIKLTSQLRPK